MSLVDQSITAIRAAVDRFKKKPLADRAGISDSLLRNVHDANWDPRCKTLRSLEKATVELERQHADPLFGSARESAAQKPAISKRRK